MVKIIREMKIEKEMTDVKGWKIPAGTVLGVVKEGPVHPRTGKTPIVVRIDNGTGIWDLCPETLINV